MGQDGLSLNESIAITTDTSDGELTWAGKDLLPLRNTQIKIKFELQIGVIFVEMP